MDETRSRAGARLVRAAALALAGLVLAARRLRRRRRHDDRRRGDDDQRDYDRAAPPSGPADTALTVVVWETGKKGPKVKTTLECDPVGGTHPLPQESCNQLLGASRVRGAGPGRRGLRPDLRRPQVARVFGTLDGKNVDATFNRANGCEISRWD